MMFVPRTTVRERIVVVEIPLAGAEKEAVLSIASHLLFDIRETSTRTD